MIYQHKGIALIYVLAITCIVALIISVMMSQFMLQRHSIKSEILEVRNFYLAEAGVKKALYYLGEEKGIDWRTGTYVADQPITDSVFWQKNDKVEISALDDAGYISITSTVKGKNSKSIAVTAAGIMPQELCYSLYLVSDKPLILREGSKLKGRVRLNHEPIFQGGSIDAVLETNQSFQLPPALTGSFSSSISYYKYLLSSPKIFEKELFSPQSFSPEKPITAKSIFVNDLVLIENNNHDSIWLAGNNQTIVSTAEVQISGTTTMNNVTIIAVGPIRILDNAQIRSSKLYSETAIEVREDAAFSGVLIAPEIIVSEKAKILYPSNLYCGPPFDHGRISINSDSTFWGNIINLCTSNKSRTVIDHNTEIEGLVYSYALVTLKGTVSGHMFCKGFHESAADTSNTNILSGVIKSSSNPKLITIPFLFSEITEFKVIKWQEL